MSRLSSIPEEKAKGRRLWGLPSSDQATSRSRLPSPQSVQRALVFSRGGCGCRPPTNRTVAPTTTSCAPTRSSLGLPLATGGRRRARRGSAGHSGNLMPASATRADPDLERPVGSGCLTADSRFTIIRGALSAAQAAVLDCLELEGLEGDAGAASEGLRHCAT